MISVLIVDDSVLVRKVLNQFFKEDPRFEVVGEAENGLRAIVENRRLSPDLIIMDINMPVMNGIEATQQILENTNPAIIVFSTEDSADIMYKCLEAGALDIIQKPNIASMNASMMKAFYERVYVIAKKHKEEKIPEHKSSQIPDQNISYHNNKYDILIIGASTGGPAAIQTILSKLKKDFPVPILITQHIDSFFDEQFTKWLNETTDIEVELAKTGTVPQKGHAYIAPANKHLIMRNANNKITIVLDDGEPVHFLKPAVDKMFFSVASIYKEKTLAIILTGMGKDGAEGCVAVKNMGGFTIAEDETSCIVFGMPKAAIDEGGACSVLALDKIAGFIEKIIAR
ncbi:MAG: chemotaxis-specific protein-glutamate methyltransferase CheB [Treponema sp.]|nr:chemotaxis-specific protein-glutamate methyltransferase CheB [Treponema sp.]